MRIYKVKHIDNITCSLPCSNLKYSAHKSSPLQLSHILIAVLNDLHQQQKLSVQIANCQK